MSIREPFSLKSKLFQPSVLVFIFTGFTISSVQAQISMKVELLSNIDFAANAADIWGYVDSEGNEYAIIGLTNGTAVVNITNPEAPDLVGTVAGPNSLWRDIKTFSHFAYVVEDQTPSVNALQIIDLSDLPNSVSLAATYNATFSHAHNLYIDEDNGFAYVVGGDVAGGIGGISRLSLANPTAPVEVSKYSDNYVHDIFVRNDTAYASAIFSGKLQIIKFSDFVFPILLTEFNTVPHNFTHNAWTTEDGRIVATTDEVVGGTLKLWDISDLGDIDLLDTYSANASAIIHNVHIKGALAFVSYYTEGLRIVDISEPGNATEVGFYDTWPGPSGGFNGAWGVYPFLPSGNIIVSDIESGLFVFALTGELASRVTARVECPENVRQGCAITVPVTIDVSQTFPEEALGAYNATLTWNPSLFDYVGFSGGPPPFDNPIVNEANTAAGELSFEQSDATGVGGAVSIINVEFNVIGDPESSGVLDLEFSEITAAGTQNDLLSITTIEDCSFEIAPGCLLGDVTNDDLPSGFDALVIAAFVVDLPIPLEFLERIERGCCDVTQDGECTGFDALVIATFAVALHIPDEFPVGEPLCP